VVEISPLGLVEMTRQNITLGLREVMTTTCPTCRGSGVVLSEESAALEVERGMRRLARQGAGQAAGQVLCVELHPRVAALLLAGHSPRLKQLEAQTGVRFMIQAAEEGSPLDRLEVITS
jgi:ribonuclease G